MDEDGLLSKFHEMDKDGCGYISRKDVKRCMKASGFNSDFVNEFIKTFDLDGDGKISLNEYKQVLNIIPVKERQTAIWHNVFNEIDVDKSGTISISELFTMLKQMGHNMKISELKAWISTHDVNKDGELNYDEFLTFLNE